LSCLLLYQWRLGLEYVIRILDHEGKLKKERFIFSSECVLDKKIIFKKLLKENIRGRKLSGSFFNKSTESLKQEEFLKGVLD
jgi:hypothetical protein